MHHTRFPDLTYLEVRKQTRSLGSQRAEARRTGAPGRGRGAGSSKEQGQLQGGKGVKQALKNRRCGRYCVQSGDQVEPPEVLDGSTWTDFTPRTLRSLWKVWIREEHNHIYSFKIQSRGAFLSHHFPSQNFHGVLQPLPGALSPRTAIVCSIWSNWKAYLSFQCNRKRTENCTVPNMQRATLASIYFNYLSPTL